MNPKDIVEPDQYELFGAVDLGDEPIEVEFKEYDGDYALPPDEGSITYTLDNLTTGTIGTTFAGDEPYFFGKDVHDELQEEELTEKYAHLKELKAKYTHELDRMKTWEKLTKQQK